MTALGAILAIIAASFIVSLAIYGGFHVLANIEERFRPLLPSDDAPGDIANLPEGFLFHGKDS